MSVSTTWLRGEGGLRLRLPFGDEGRVIVTPHAGLVKERFAFTGDPTLTSFLPDVSYLFWDVGLDGRFRVGPIALLLNASYLPAISSGELADRFRDASFSAVELGGGFAIPLARIFEVRATVEYSRAFYSFTPNVGDLYVAGGALDQFVRADLLATLML